MSCQACTDARERMHHAFNDCRGCRARAVARSQHFAMAFKEQRQHREYLQLIEQVGVTHEDVVAAARDDRGCDYLLGKSSATPGAEALPHEDSPASSISLPTQDGPP